MAIILIATVTVGLYLITDDSEGATTYTDGDWDFQLSGSEARIIQYNGSGGNIVVPSTVTSGNTYSVTILGSNTYGDGVFDTLTVDSTVTVSFNNLSIQPYAFWNCDHISEINLMSNNAINPPCFYNNTSLTAINVTGQGSNYSEDGVLFSSSRGELVCYPASKSSTQYTVPANISLGRYAFTGTQYLQTLNIPSSPNVNVNGVYECPSLVTVNVGAGTNTINSWNFALCENLMSINVDSGNTMYSSDDGVLYNKDKTTLVRYPMGKTETTFQIP